MAELFLPMRPKVVIIPLQEVTILPDYDTWVALRNTIGAEYKLKSSKMKFIHPLEDRLPPWFTMKEEFGRLLKTIEPELLNKITQELDDELFKIISSKNELISQINLLSRYVKIIFLNPFSPALSNRIGKLFSKNVVLFNPGSMGYRHGSKETFAHAANLAGVTLDKSCYLLADLTHYPEAKELNLTIIDNSLGPILGLKTFRERYSTK